MKKIIKQFKNIVSEYRTGKSLKARAARGSSWLSIGSGTEQILRLVRNMVLTRLLVPEAFGLMAIIMAVNVFFDSFTRVGIKEAVIQNPDGDMNTFLNGAWFFSLGRSSVLYAVAFFGAPLIARFYNNMELLPMMRFAFLGLIFRGLMSPKAYVTVKNLKFKQWIMIEQAGGIIGILTAITLGFIIHNVWALVIGFNVEFFAQMILSYIVCPFLPRLNFHKRHIYSLLKFAGGMFGIPILTFIFMRLDIFVIGKLCTAEELGLYSMAAALARVPYTFVQKFMAPLLMPSFSEMQNDFTRINRSVINIHKVFGFIGIPLIIFIIFYGEKLLSIIYTPQYAQVAIPFTILFSAIMMQIFNTSIVSVYLAIGKPEALRLFTGLRAALHVIMIYPLMQCFGIAGASISVLISMLISYFFQILSMKKITGIAMLQYWTALISPILISVLIIIVWAATNRFFTNPYFSVLFGFLGLLITYGLSVFLQLQKRKVKLFQIIKL